MSALQHAVVEVYAGLPERIWIRASEAEAVLTAERVAKDLGLPPVGDFGYWESGDHMIVVRPVELEGSYLGAVK